MRGDSPPLVVRPADVEQVAGALRVADERGIAVFPVGGPPYPTRSGIVLDLARLDSVVELNAEDTLAVVQAGLPVARLAEAAREVGLDYPQASTASDGATVGGALAKGGVRAPGWGPDREQVLGLRVALADGRLVQVGSRAIKNQTGYSLTQLVVGARGALGVIVEATLRLWPRLGARKTLLARFASVSSAARAAARLGKLPLPPAAVEMLDQGALETVGFPDDSAAALLVLVAGTDAAEVAGQAASLVALLGEEFAGAPIVLDDEESGRAWADRRRLQSALAARWRDLFTVEVGLPLDRVGAFMAEAARLAAAAEARAVLFGGAGLGAVTVAVLDAAEARGIELARGLTGAARTAGGLPLDVVGLGLDYDDWLGLVLPPASAEAMRRVRAALDPRGTLRPART